MSFQSGVPHRCRALQNYDSGERLRLPLQVTEIVCKCGTVLDSTGRRRAACSRSGRLKTGELLRRRGPWTGFAEKQERQCDAPRHEPRSEDLASGLPWFFGAQLAVDITVRCPLPAGGTAQSGTARVHGAVCTRAREDKERRYSELLCGDRSSSLSKREDDGTRKLSSLLNALPIDRPCSGVETVVSHGCCLGRSILCQLVGGSPRGVACPRCSGRGRS